MSRHKLFYLDSKFVRDRLNEAEALAEQIHAGEEELIGQLYRIDRQRLYVRYGHRSLMGFCRISLRFSRTQAQRIVTRVRRYEPTVNIVDRRGDDGA